MKKNAWSLTLAKKLLNFSRRKQSQSHGLIINSINIQEVNVVKLLGCQISKTLNWDKHIQKMRSKLNSCLYHMKVLQKRVNKGKLQNLYYHSFIFPNLTVCSGLFYYSLTPSQKQTLNSQRKKAIQLLPPSQRAKPSLDSLMQQKAGKTWERMETSGLLEEYQRASRFRQKTRMMFARTEIR